MHSDYRQQGHIAPLFWQHGEDEETLRREIGKIEESGIDSFIVESRPHPDYLSYGWWRDLDIILDEAGKRNMHVWIFDDGAFPSGYGGGKLKTLYPEALKVYLRQSHIDAVGPVAGSTFRIRPWIREGEELVRIVAARRNREGDDLEDGSFLDLTEYCRDGILYWEVPEGAWRIFLFLKTREGGEEWTKDYVNPIDARAVEKYIQVIYEEHYRRYQELFGSLISGFFIDEPRFGNAASYDMELGMNSPSRGLITGVLPYSDQLLDILDREMGEDFGLLLPYLWTGRSSRAQDVRFAYMNVVTRLFGRNFIGQIGDWCRAHGIRAIGHVIEDNGAHARLGYGCGHFFRAMEGMDMSGLDVVYQIWPEFLDGRHSTPFGYLDSRFYYWGMTRMASSLAALDPKKKGITACEVFGAYGWQEGLKLMKWLTDHICVRGVNFVIPHAFSPKEYPDPDCPPHFYAGGRNPQWEYFHIWAGYAQRVCGLLSQGREKVRIAVLYHAEAEWGGAYEPFEKAVEALMSHQISCHVVSLDYLSEGVPKDGKLCIHNNQYDTLIIPYGEVWPEALYHRVEEMSREGVTVIFMEKMPSRCYFHSPRKLDWEKVSRMNHVYMTEYEKLPGMLKEAGKTDLQSSAASPYLIFASREREEGELYFFVNQSRNRSIRSRITVRGEKTLKLYDALEDISYDLDVEYENGSTSFTIELTPYQSLFVLGAEERAGKRRVWEDPDDPGTEIPGPWKITACGSQADEKLTGLTSLKNMASPDLLPEYSGTFFYETEIAADPAGRGEKIWLDLGEVYETAEVVLNGKTQGVRICPPYRVELTDLVQGENHLCIKVANTLAKEQGDNTFDRAMPQEPSGLLGPVRLIRKDG